MDNKKYIVFYFLGTMLFTFLSGAFWMKMLSYGKISREFFMIMSLTLLSIMGMYVTSKAYFLLLSRNYERKQNDELVSVNQNKKKPLKS